MKKILLLLLLINQGLFAQSLPTNPKPGRCYFKFIDYSFKEKISWSEVDCNDAKQYSDSITNQNNNINKFEIVVLHQQKLKNLGYDIEINGCLDSKTEIAHNKYIDKIRKVEKIEERKKRKADRKKRKEKNK